MAIPSELLRTAPFPWLLAAVGGVAPAAVARAAAPDPDDDEDEEDEDDDESSDGNIEPDEDEGYDDEDDEDDDEEPWQVRPGVALAPRWRCCGASSRFGDMAPPHRAARSLGSGARNRHTSPACR